MPDRVQRYPVFVWGQYWPRSQVRLVEFKKNFRSLIGKLETEEGTIRSRGMGCYRSRQASFVVYKDGYIVMNYMLTSCQKIQPDIKCWSLFNLSFRFKINLKVAIILGFSQAHQKVLFKRQVLKVVLQCCSFVSSGAFHSMGRVYNCNFVNNSILGCGTVSKLAFQSSILSR